MDDRLDEKAFTNRMHKFIIRSIAPADFQNKDYGRNEKNIYGRICQNYYGR